MTQLTHNNPMEFLSNFPKDEIISVLKAIDTEIGSLHAISSKDFLYFNQLLKNYYNQIKVLSEGNNTITNYFTTEYPDIIGKLIELNQKQQTSVKLIKEFGESYLKRVSFCYNSFNLLVVPCNNFEQNLRTLKFVLANLNLHLSYVKLNNTNELKHAVEHFEYTIDKLLLKSEHSKAQSDKLVETLVGIKNNASNHLSDLKSEYEKVVEHLYTDNKILSNNHFFSPSNYLNLNKYVQSSFDNMGEIITNIQYHDIIRQKMEHIQASQHDLIEGLGQMSLSEVDQNENQALSVIVKIPEIADIQVAQLLYTNKDYQNSIERITKKLIQVGTEMKSLTDVYTMLILECNQFNERFVLHYAKTQQQYNSYCGHFMDKWKDGFGKITDLKCDYLALKNEFSELFSLEKDLRANIKDLKKLLNANGQSIGDELVNRLMDMMTELQTNSNSIKGQFNIITNQLNELTLQGESILDKKYNVTDSAIQGQELTLKNKTTIESLSKLNATSSLIAQEITSSINNIEYYTFFNNTVEEIIKKLKYISQQISIENLKKLVADNDVFMQKIERLYTMKSEREIHHKVLNLGIEVENETESPSDIDENDLELF